MEPSEVEAPTSSAAARCWVKEVRELSYDIDDFLDELVYGLNATAASHKDLRGKIAKVREDRSRSRWVADETTRFKSRLEEAIQRHKRYNLDKLQNRQIRIDSNEPPIPPLYGVTVARLVDNNGQKELYCKLRGQFECRAFARSAMKPDIRRLHAHQHTLEEWLIDDLELHNRTIRAHLRHKR
uniref:Disease resistance N-terminal domain-containing protein n=1 Tax=Setaria viridis TaxID=4556 RepID=A0A4U6TMP2_SETVI|nr:hypothetical protein SEVIR_8G248900v2 [Setaria viridis]